ncbi:MAG: AMP-binding protein [Actinomycetota bacterium]
MTETRVPDWVKTWAIVAPDSPALRSGDGAWTFADLDEQADRSARTLLEQGVGPGSLLGFPSSATPGSIVTLIGGPRSGATLFAVGEGGDAQVSEAPSLGYAVVATSGSGGRARRVVLTEENVLAAVTGSQERIGNDDSDRWLLCLPLHHIAGLSVVWRSFAAGGSVLLHDRFDAARAAAALKNGDATLASLVPTMLHRILRADPGPYRGVKAVLLGGAPAGTDLVERALDAGLPILQTYGMTEACSQVTTVAPGEANDALGTAGRPLSGMAVTIDRGEILVDGPAVSPGYLGEPPREGPFRTGDLGRFDGHGRLVVEGRIGGVIVTGGENVHPSTVELALESHPAVAAVVVIGVEDEDWGEIVAAVIEAPVDSVASIAAHAEQRLARHEMPKRWATVDAVPLLANGKPDRAAARMLVTEIEPPA